MAQRTSEGVVADAAAANLRTTLIAGNRVLVPHHDVSHVQFLGRAGDLSARQTKCTLGSHYFHAVSCPLSHDPSAG